MIVPTLLDSAMIPVKVRCSGGCGWASLSSRSAHWYLSLTSNTVSGLTAPASRAAAAVMTLFVLPGSNTSDTARLPQSVAGRVLHLLRSTSGALAMASTWPFRTSMTITLPLRAPASLTCLAMASWAAHWMSRSMVSRTPCPATGSCLVLRVMGMRCPVPPISMVWRPSLPPRSLS